MTWVQTQKLLASNHAPLQALLYMYEKRRLEAIDKRSATTDDESRYEHLLGGLLEDPRVGRILLQNGRPKTVAQCIQGLRAWCGIPTKDGETLVNLNVLGALKMVWRMNLMLKSNAARKDDLLGLDIPANGYKLSNEMRDRVTAREGTDDDALRRYLLWEATIPSFLKLEASLVTALRKLPQWQETHLSQSSLSLPREEWLDEIRNVLDAGLHILFHKANVKIAFGSFEVSSLLENAILKLALKLPGYQDALKAAYAETFRPLSASCKGPFAEELLQVTAPKRETVLETFARGKDENLSSYRPQPRIELC